MIDCGRCPKGKIVCIVACAEKSEEWDLVDLELQGRIPPKGSRVVVDPGSPGGDLTAALRYRVDGRGNLVAESISFEEFYAGGKGHD